MIFRWTEQMTRRKRWPCDRWKSDQVTKVTGDLAVGGDAAWSGAGDTPPDGKTWEMIKRQFKASLWLQFIGKWSIDSRYSLKSDQWGGRWRWRKADRTRGSWRSTDTDHTWWSPGSVCVSLFFKLLVIGGNVIGICAQLSSITRHRDHHVRISQTWAMVCSAF